MKPAPDRQPTRLPITVGYLGRLERVKGVHDLVRAATSLPSLTATDDAQDSIFDITQPNPKLPDET